MSNLFKLSELKAKVEVVTDPSEKKVVRFLNKHYEKVESLKNLLGRFPEAGEAYFLYTLKSFNAFTFIVYTIKHVGRIEKLIFSTYSINERIINSLIRYYDKGDIRSIKIIISDSIKHRMPKVYDMLELHAQSRNMEVIYSWNHSKVTLIRTEAYHFVIEGSGNFSENAMHEQYIYCNDQDLFDFRSDCLLSFNQPID